MSEYNNLFAMIGVSKEEVNKRISQCFHTIFFDEEEKFYFEKGEDEAYLLDTGNSDARSEGISYGMMMAVQMDRKDIFDRLWTFAKRNMYMTEGVHQGYFAWSVGPDGKKNAQGPAPDGEEYFAMALFFAKERWGDGQEPYDYEKQARDILNHCLHQDKLVDGGYTMWNLDNHQIKFVPEVEFTDPSYHLPHFYELFAQRANESDKAFWKKAAETSVEFLKSTPHKETGMTPEYSEYNGNPRRLFRDEEFYSDAYRVAMNMGLDALWFARNGYGEIVEKLQNFFKDMDPKDYSSYLVDGSDLNQKALHPVAIIATNAAACLTMIDKNESKQEEEALSPDALYWLKKFWETPMRKGERRYYDNCLYFFCLLMLAGKFKIY